MVSRRDSYTHSSRNSVYSGQNDISKVNNLLVEFENPEFSTLDWVNDIIKQSFSEVSNNPNISIDAQINKQIQQLQMLSFNLGKRIERGTNDIMNNVPRIIDSLDIIGRDAVTLSDSLDDLLNNVSKEDNQNSENVIDDGRNNEDDSKENAKPFLNLIKLDKVLTRMYQTKNTLKEAETWLTLQSEVSSFIASGEFFQASKRLFLANQSINTLKELPNYEERMELIKSLKENLLTVLKDELNKYFNLVFSENQLPVDVNTYFDEIKLIFNCFILIDELDEFIKNYKEFITTPLKNNWNSFTLSEKKSENLIEFTKSRGLYYSNWLIDNYLVLIIRIIKKSIGIFTLSFVTNDQITSEQLSINSLSYIQHSILRTVLINTFTYCVSQQQSRLQRYLAPPPDIDIISIVNWPNFVNLYVNILNKCIDIVNELILMDNKINTNNKKLFNSSSKEKNAKNDLNLREKTSNHIKDLINNEIGLKSSNSVSSFKDLEDEENLNYSLKDNLVDNRIANQNESSLHANCNTNNDINWIEKLLLPFIPLQEISNQREKIYIEGYNLPFKVLESIINIVTSKDELLDKDIKFIEKILGTAISENNNSVLDDKDLARLIITLPGFTRTSNNNSNLSYVVNINNFSSVLNTILNNKLPSMINDSIKRINQISFGLNLVDFFSLLDKSIIPSIIKTEINVITHFKIHSGLSKKIKANNYYFNYINKKALHNSNEYSNLKTLDDIRANSNTRRIQKLSDNSSNNNLNESYEFYYEHSEDSQSNEDKSMSRSDSNATNISINTANKNDDEDHSIIFIQCMSLLNIPKEFLNNLRKITLKYYNIINDIVLPILNSFSNDEDVNIYRNAIDSYHTSNDTSNNNFNAPLALNKSIKLLLQQSSLNNINIRSIVEEIQKIIPTKSNIVSDEELDKLMNIIFNTSIIKVNDFTEVIQTLAFDSLFININTYLNHFNKDIKIWTKNPSNKHGPFDINLPQFNISPNEFITRIGEILLMLPQQLETYINTNNSNENKCISPLLYNLNSLKYLNHTEYYNEFTIFDENTQERIVNEEIIGKFDVDDISLVWISAIVQGMVEIYIWNIFTILLKSNGETYAKKGTYIELKTIIEEFNLYIEKIKSVEDNNDIEDQDKEKQKKEMIHQRILFSKYGLEQIIIDMSYLKNIMIALDIEPIPTIFEQMFNSLQFISSVFT